MSSDPPIPEPPSGSPSAPIQVPEETHESPRPQSLSSVRLVGQRRRSKGWIVGLVVVALFLTAGIMPRLRQATKLKTIQQQEIDAPAAVNVIQPTEGPADTNLTLPSNIQAFQEATIYARANGYVHELFTDIGSRVKAGQLLATIESPEVDQQYSEVQSEATKAQANDEQAEAEVSHFIANVSQAESQVIGEQSDLLTAKAQVSHSKAKLTEANGALAEARAKLNQTQRYLEGKRADLERARIKMTLAKKTYNRWQELAKGGAVSGQDLDETEAAYEGSLSAVTSAQADVQSAEADVVAAQSSLAARAGDVDAAKADVASSIERVGAATAAISSGKANVHAVQASVQAANSAVGAAKAATAASLANVQRVGALRSFEKVTAPFSGVITARNVDKGSLINAGSGNAGGASNPLSTVPNTGLFGLAQTDVLRIQVSVPESAVRSIYKGEPAYVRVQEIPNRVFKGAVYDTSGALDDKTRTMLTEVRLYNPTGILVPGMYAEVEFHFKEPVRRLQLPGSALIIDGNGTRVATVNANSQVHFKKVQVGRDLGQSVEIVSGLGLKDQIISNPPDDLTEGQTVQVVAAGKE